MTIVNGLVEAFAVAVAVALVDMLGIDFWFCCVVERIGRCDDDGYRVFLLLGTVFRTVGVLDTHSTNSSRLSGLRQDTTSWRVSKGSIILSKRVQI